MRLHPWGETVGNTFRWVSLISVSVLTVSFLRCCSIALASPALASPALTSPAVPSSSGNDHSGVVRTCSGPGQRPIHFEQNSSTIQLDYSLVSMPPQLDAARPLAPLAMQTTGVAQIANDGALLFSGVGNSAPQAATKVADVPPCRGQDCMVIRVTTPGPAPTVVAVANRAAEGTLYLVRSQRTVESAEIETETVTGINGVPFAVLIGADETSYTVIANHSGDITAQQFARTDGRFRASGSPQRVVLPFPPEHARAILYGAPRRPALLGPHGDRGSWLLVAATLDDRSNFRTVAQFEPSFLGWTFSTMVLDINADDRPDILAVAPLSVEPWVALGGSDGFLETPVRAAGAGGWLESQPVASADFNGDGVDDVLFANVSHHQWLLGVSRSVESMGSFLGRVDQTTFETDAEGVACVSAEALAPGVVVMVNDLPYQAIRRRLLSTGEHLLLRAVVSDGSALSISSVPKGPFVCLGYQPSGGSQYPFVFPSKWGASHAQCPSDYGFYSTGEAGPRTPNESELSAPCCPLPYEHMFVGDAVPASERCEEGMVVVGEEIRESDGASHGVVRREWWCRKLSDRFQLGEETGGVYFGSGFSSRGHQKRMRRDQIPLAIRASASRLVFNQWDADGCIGDPPGSLLVGRTKSGIGCDRIRFRRLQYRGAPGDPPQGTDVTMFPSCRSIGPVFLPNSGCDGGPSTTK